MQLCYISAKRFGRTSHRACSLQAFAASADETTNVVNTAPPKPRARQQDVDHMCDQDQRYTSDTVTN